MNEFDRIENSNSEVEKSDGHYSLKGDISEVIQWYRLFYFDFILPVPPSTTPFEAITE